MKFLLAIGSKQYSGPTLKLGAEIAQVFGAELNIVYVGPKTKGIQDGPLDLARTSLSHWNIHHPGLEVLEWAFNELKKICPDHADLRQAEFDPKNIVEEGNRFKVILPATQGCRVQLTLREGELINELREELQMEEYALTIIGGSQGNRKMAHDLIQYLPSSILIARNLDLKKQYKLLLLVDDSELTEKSVRFGAEIAKTEKWDIRTLTVSKTERFGTGYQGAADNAKAYLEKQGLNVEQFFITGDPVTTFIQFAGDDHIMIMGMSTANPLLKFFKGSKPIKTLEKSTVPILVIK